VQAIEKQSNSQMCFKPLTKDFRTPFYVAIVFTISRTKTFYDSRKFDPPAHAAVQRRPCGA
jgi:hypothetical protein